MATLAGSVFPMAPVGGPGGTKSADHVVAPLDVSETITAGDILTIVAATRDVEDTNTDPGAGSIFGVAVLSADTNAVSVAAVDRDERIGPDASGDWHAINVALALPGQRFQGNVVAGAATDETGVYADNVHIRLGVVEADTSGYAAIDQADTTNVAVFTMGYVNPQVDVTDANNAYAFGREAGVGLTNPRVEFYFIAVETVFG